MKKILRAVLVTLLVNLTTGCFVASVEHSGHTDNVSGYFFPMPAPAHEVISGTEFEPQDVAFVQSGRTTRADITNTFDQPWAYYPDLAVMVYYWESVDWHWVGGLSANEDQISGSGNITSLHYWFVKFDHDDLVERHGFVRASPNAPTKMLAANNPTSQ